MLLMRPGWIASLRERHHLPAITHKKEFLAVALCFCSVNPLLRSVPKNRCSGSKPEGSRAHLCQLPQYWLMHLVSLLASRAQGGSALGVLQPDLVMPIVVRSIGGGLKAFGRRLIVASLRLELSKLGVQMVHLAGKMVF